jgi:DNA (cytosine-5)-methyltransferase 1
MTVGSLFSGIGGIDLGLERAGFRVIWQCESDPFARRVLAKHWPGIPCYQDVRLIDERVECPELLCGGFPCQDVSCAGRRAGIEGERSGLWAEFARVVLLLRPRFVLVENTPGLYVRGLGRVLGDLADGGYDAEWQCIPAAAVGAPHLRARIWILAYPRGERVEAGIETPLLAGRLQPELCTGWAPEPDVDRLAHGIPRGLAGRMLAMMGNAAVPQVAEMIGRCINPVLD